MIESILKELSETLYTSWMYFFDGEGRALLIFDGLDGLPPNKGPKSWKSLQDCLEKHGGFVFE